MRKITKYISFGGLLTITILLAATTVIEKFRGSEFVVQNIYGSWWFVLLWALTATAAFIYILYEKAYRKKVSFLLHAALLTILLGAFTTYTTAERGYIHLRQGKPANSYTADDGITKRTLPFDIRLILFDIEYHVESDEPADFISFLQVDGEMCKVSMNNIHKYKNYRFYQYSFDNDEMGTTLLVSHDPWGISITYAGYFLLALSMVFLLWIKIGWKGLLCIIAPTALLWFYISQLNPMTPILRSPMLAAHVSIIIISYVLFVLMAVLSAVGLCSKKREQHLYLFNSQLLYPALFTLALGIFIGAVWANISWGRYWGWDAKETWALITLFVYSFPIHKKSLPFFSNPRKFHWYCTLAFLTVLMTFLGVSFLLGGIHSYL